MKLGKFTPTNFVFLEQFIHGRDNVFQNSFSRIQFLCIMNKFICGKIVTCVENTELNTFKHLFLIYELLRAFGICSMKLQELVESEGFTKFICVQKIIFL